MSEMKIGDATNAVKIANVVVDDEKVHKLIQFEYICDERVAKQDLTRVYFFVVDGVIKKIGGSSAKGGIKRGTLSPYQAGLSGDPHRDRIYAQVQLRAELNRGSKCEVWAIFVPNTKAIVKGLISEEEKEGEKPSHKSSEKKCLQDYFQVMEDYPPWNLQESRKTYPEKIDELHRYYINKKQQDQATPSGGKKYRAYSKEELKELSQIIKDAIVECISENPKLENTYEETNE